MGFWVFMLMVTMAIPLVMVVLGRRFMQKPPLHISKTFGYRTTRSMKNRDTWTFSQRYFGKAWFYTGLPLLGLSVLGMLPVRNQNVSVIGGVGALVCAVQCIAMLLAACCTEQALRRSFDAQGRRR